MGKLRGFIEFDRTDESYVPVAKRIKNYDEFTIKPSDKELEKQGDFITHHIGRESILMVKDKNNKVRAYHNVCPHRGNRLVHVDSGYVDDFTCTYHGWKFNYSGDLIYAQDQEDFPQGNPCGKVKLSEIPCEE